MLDVRRSTLIDGRPVALARAVRNLVSNAVRYGGAAFLFVYGVMNFKAAAAGGDALQDKGRTASSFVVA